MISSKQRANLRSMANTLAPIFQIGKGNINDNFIEQIDGALETRELIKISILETADITAREASDQLCEALGAEPVQCIGRKAQQGKPKDRDIALRLGACLAKPPGGGAEAEAGRSHEPVVQGVIHKEGKPRQAGCGYYIAPQPSRCEYRSTGGFFIYPLTLKFRKYCGIGFLGGGRQFF